MEAQARKRSTVLIAIVAGVVAAIVLHKVFEERRAPEAPGASGTPAVAAPIPAPSAPEIESKYPECRKLEAIYRQMNNKHGCDWDGWAFGHVICALVYNDRKDCIDKFEAMARCMAAQPESSWQCDAEGKVGLKEKICAAEISALQACGGRHK